MRRPVRRVLTVVALLVVVYAAPGCPKRPQPWPWAETRADLVRRSRVWLGDDEAEWMRRIRSLDLATGPWGGPGLGRDALARCTYVEPARAAPLGNTPKFFCRRSEGGSADEFKVKWGEENGEVYAEVAGSRLLWALGFPADAVYAARVQCEGCPDDPWRDRKPRPGRTTLFEPATIERQFPGRTIEEFADQGWTWAELETVDADAGGAPRAHRDALKLLAAFVQHRDNKPSNQRLVCQSGIGWRCRRPLLVVHDLGSVFGGPRLLGTEKMSLEDWKREPVWKDARRCIGNLTAEHEPREGLQLPRIGEEGRRFLARLLEALDDPQIAALFEAARGNRRGGVAAWVATFKAKREQVLRPVPSDPEFRCPQGS